jgi:hypothetical protein
MGGVVGVGWGAVGRDGVRGGEGALSAASGGGHAGPRLPHEGHTRQLSPPARLPDVLLINGDAGTGRPARRAPPLPHEGHTRQLSRPARLPDVPLINGDAGTPGRGAHAAAFATRPAA